MRTCVVHLVLEPEFAGDLPELLRDAHVWLLESTHNVGMIDANRRAIESPYLLSICEPSARNLDVLYASLEEIEIHHGFYDELGPWREIRVHGVGVNEVDAGRIRSSIDDKIELEVTREGFSIRSRAEPRPEIEAPNLECYSLMKQSMEQMKLRGDALLDALEDGSVRVAEPTASGDWIVNTWVKDAILELFRSTSIVAKGLEGEPGLFRDKEPLDVRRFDEASKVRVVPGGSAVRRGAHLGEGVVCMPPMYVNLGAFVGAGSMVDSHALVGSCAQIGAGVHLSAAAQIGGVLEPPGARPVIVEDGAFIGGGVGIYEGVLVRRGAVIAGGVQLTASTPVYDLVHERELRGTRAAPLEIPANAVVLPGTRPVSSAWGRERGLSQACALIVKYRDESTDQGTALEDALRAQPGASDEPPAASASATRARRASEQQRRDAVRIAVFRWILDGGPWRDEEDLDDEGLDASRDDEARGGGTEREAPGGPVFLSLFLRADPAPAVFEALSDREEELLPISAARKGEDGYRDARGRPASVLFVNRIEWIDERTAELSAGQFAGPLAAWTNRVRVREREGGWDVEDLGLEQIS